MNANMGTTQKRPKPPTPEIKFRDHVDHTVDIMNRLSVTRLKKMIDTQRELEILKAL